MPTRPDWSLKRAVSSSTAVLGVIGDPVRHSLSPALHNAAYQALGLDLLYLAFPVASGEAARAISGARALGFVGLSVTTPHKADAARHADQRSPLVERLAAANTIVFRSGIASAESTDGPGLLRDLRQACDFEVKGKVCAVLGAGGAGRAIIAALADAGAASVLVVNRSLARGAAALALAPQVASIASLEDSAKAELVVNATSIGLLGTSVDRPDDPGVGLARFLHRGQLVVDLVYRPAKTPFLLAAVRAGARTRNGLGMLVQQAGLQVELFTGEPAPLQAMWETVRSQEDVST